MFRWYDDETSSIIDIKCISRKRDVKAFQFLTKQLFQHRSTVHGHFWIVNDISIQVPNGWRSRMKYDCVFSCSQNLERDNLNTEDWCLKRVNFWIYTPFAKKLLSLFSWYSCQELPTVDDLVLRNIQESTYRLQRRDFLVFCLVGVTLGRLRITAPIYYFGVIWE